MPTLPDTPGAPTAVELPAISIQGLSKSFGTNEVLKDISLDVATGEVVCVIGPSGSGKSTLLRCVNMLETPTSGTIHVGADEMTDPDVDIDRVRRRIGMVFQSFNLFPHLTVLQNLTIAQTKVLRRSKAEADKVARHNLERVGMTHKEDAFPAQPIDAHVNSSRFAGGCGSFYEPATKRIELSAGCPGTPNFATSSDILIHEYTHGIVNNVYDLPPTGEAGALGEGISDFYAASFNGDPTFGETILAQPRQLANALTTQDADGDTHHDGQILGGALWDTRLALGKDKAEAYALGAIYRFPTSFDEMLTKLGKKRAEAMRDSSIAMFTASPSPKLVSG